MNSHGESNCQRNAILHISVNRLETKETKVVGGWDFSCVNARKWQRLPLSACGVYPICRWDASWTRIQIEPNLPAHGSPVGNT